jgi:hypothetical protein
VEQAGAVRPQNRSRLGGVRPGRRPSMTVARPPVDTQTTSPSPWHRRHLGRTYGATPSAWVGRMCPGTRSALSASRPTSGLTSGSASTSSCATATTSTHLLPPARGDGPVDRKRLEPVVPHALRWNSPTMRICPRAGREHRSRSGSAGTTSSTIRRRQRAAASARQLDADEPLLRHSPLPA